MLSLVQILFSFVSNSLTYFTIPKNKRKELWTKDKIEPQHIHNTIITYTIQAIYEPIIGNKIIDTLTF